MNLKFKDAAIKNKLVIMIMSVSVGSLLVAYAAFVVFQITTIRHFLEHDQSVMMNFLGEALVAPLNFNVPADAEALLESLAANEDVAYVGVYDRDGALFARYAAAGVADPPFNIDRSAMQFTLTNLTLFRPIEGFPGEVDGYLLMSTDLGSQHQSMLRSLLFFLLVLVALICLALLIASRMQQLVSEPIILLAETMDWVSKSGNYDRSINFDNKDEIGMLTRGFNRMLEQIENQNSALTAEQRTLRESEANYRGIFENVMEGIFQCSAQGEVLKVNPAFLQLLGYESLTVMQEAVKDMRTQLYANELDTDHTKAQLANHHRIKDYETRLVRADGSVIDVSLNLQEVRDEHGSLRYYEGMVTDISQRLRAEQLAVAKDAAESADRAKSQFLANMSHEIRTPLNAVLGFTELMLNDPHMDWETRRHYLKMVYDSSSSLLMIINDILDFSKVDARKMSLESRPFDLWALMERLGQMFQSSADSKSLTLWLDLAPNTPRFLIGDSLRLGQVLINLIGNALKFTETGGVTLRVGLDKNADRMAFEVRDTGVGIEAEKLESVFNAFSQADETTNRRFGGTGLGLAISQRLVALMGGKLNVESEMGRGSCFSFQLKLAPDPNHLNPGDRPVQGACNALVYAASGEEAFMWARGLTAQGLNAEVLAESHELTETDSKPHLILIEGHLDPKPLKALQQLASNGTAVFQVVSRYNSSNFNPADNPHLRAGLVRPVTPLLLEAMLTRFRQPKESDSFFLNPIDPESDPTQPPHHVASKLSTRAYRILLVEDTRVNRVLARAILERAGMFVAEAENGAVALELLAGADYDLVLMDIQMPVMDGLQTTRAIRKLKQFKALPIIAMTAHSMSSDRDRCLEAGMNDYVTKPIDTAYLFEVLNKHLKHVHAPRGGVWDPEFLPKSLAGFDLAEAYQRIGSSERGLFQVLQNFARQFEKAPEELKRLLDNQEFKAAKALLHTLKGAGGNVSATKVYELAAAGERALRKKQGSDYDPNDLLEALKEVLGSVLSMDMTQLQARANANPCQTKDLAPLLRKLQVLVDHCEMEAEDLFADFKQAASGCRLDDLIQQLSRHIEDLDFDNAALILTQIQTRLDGTGQGGDTHE